MQSWPHQDLLSRNVLRQLTDGLTVLARILRDRDSCQLGTLSTILQNFTQLETQWPKAACRCHFALRGVSCMQSWHLLTPSHLRVPPEWSYCRQAQCRRWFTVCSEVYSRLTYPVKKIDYISNDLIEKGEIGWQWENWKFELRLE